ncbi:hypothetical protein E3Q17_03315 [Wallemia mellicola]|uniref:PD-(D/E)XK endonuclease-like domain-containing protein n=1 Tax=Wallemia mellicola TaxID=1708541 RepID=A0A4T0NN77_9BASI|nr:hypothetical protein E3Q17_03315 [Wallemia mellicola]
MSDYDKEFDDNWLDTAEVRAFAEEIEARIDNKDKKRDRSTSIEIITTPPYERFRKKAGFLAATDISEIQWCAYQKLYNEITGGSTIPVNKRTAEIIGDTGKKVTIDRSKALAKEELMDKGSIHHDKLERELYGYLEDDLVDIRFEDDVDYYVVWLHQCCEQLATLETQGRCREFGVRGYIDGHTVQGDIDELKLDRNTNKVRVIDDKTRSDGCMPRYTNRGHRAQLMVYHKLLSGFPTFDWEAWFTTHQIDIDQEVKTPLIRQQLMTEDKPSLTLRPLIAQLRRVSVFMLGNIDEEVEIVYHNANDGRHIGRDVFKYEEEEFAGYIKQAFDFWFKGQYQGVDIEEVYKCNSCEYRENCEWLDLQHKKALSRNKKSKLI